MVVSSRRIAKRQVERYGGSLKDQVDHRLVVPALARVARRGAPVAQRAPHAIVVPSQRPGSLGDQAMVVSLLGQLAGQGIPVTLGEYDDDVTWAAGVQTADTLSLARLFHLQQQVHPLAYLDLLAFARACATATHVFVVGADVLDGHYHESRSVKRWLLAALAALAGLDSRVINFSFNGSPGPRSAAAAVAATASGAVRLFARDGVAHERIGALTRQDSVVHADIAFNLKPERTPLVEQAGAWVATQRAAGRQVVGVNVNPQSFQYMEGIDAVETVRTLTARSLADADAAAQGNVAWLFIPHDWRPPITEEELAHQTIALLPEAVRPRTYVTPGPYSAMEAKALAAECDIVITGRMHLAIASLGVGTPPLCLPYQGKFEGLMAHFGLPRLVLGLDDIIADGTFGPQLSATLEDRDEIGRTLAEHVEGIRASARVPLAI